MFAVILNIIRWATFVNGEYGTGTISSCSRSGAVHHNMKHHNMQLLFRSHPDDLPSLRKHGRGGLIVSSFDYIGVEEAWDQAQKDGVAEVELGLHCSCDSA